MWEKVDGASNDYLALRFAERYSCQATKTAKLVQSLEYVPEAEDFDNYLLTGEIGVEAAMSERLRSVRTPVETSSSSMRATASSTASDDVSSVRSADSGGS